MDDDRSRIQLVRQLKILNFWVTSIAIVIIIGLVIIGILLFQIISFVHETKDQINRISTSTYQKLDIKSQACAGTDSFSTFIKNKTDVCNR